MEHRGTIGIIGILAVTARFRESRHAALCALLIFFGYLLFGIWTVLMFITPRAPAFVSQWFLWRRSFGSRGSIRRLFVAGQFSRARRCQRLSPVVLE